MAVRALKAVQPHGHARGGAHTFHRKNGDSSCLGCSLHYSCRVHPSALLLQDRAAQQLGTGVLTRQMTER